VKEASTHSVPRKRVFGEAGCGLSSRTPPDALGSAGGPAIDGGPASLAGLGRMPVDGDVRRDPAAAQVLDVRPPRRRRCRTPLAANHSAQRHRFAYLGWTIGRPVGESQ
jgi:hypothetical protein